MSKELNITEEIFDKIMDETFISKMCKGLLKLLFKKTPSQGEIAVDESVQLIAEEIIMKHKNNGVSKSDMLKAIEAEKEEFHLDYPGLYRMVFDAYK